MIVNERPPDTVGGERMPGQWMCRHNYGHRQVTSVIKGKIQNI